MARSVKAIKAKLKQLRARTHPIYGKATPEDVALKLRRDVAKPVRTAKTAG